MQNEKLKSDQPSRTAIRRTELTAMSARLAAAAFELSKSKHADSLILAKRFERAASAVDAVLISWPGDYPAVIDRDSGRSLNPES